MKNLAIAFALFYTLVVLINVSWDQGFKEGYDIVDTQLSNNSQNVFKQLKNSNFIQGINDLKAGIEKTTKLSGITDVLGGIALSGSGILQTIGGIVTFPLDIINALDGYYTNYIPSIVGQFLGFIVIIVVGFILLSAKLGFEL